MDTYTRDDTAWSAVYMEVAQWILTCVTLLPIWYDTHMRDVAANMVWLAAPAKYVTQVSQ